MRVGKGEGYSDLEWGVLSRLGAVDDDTTVATTVHERQVVDESPSPADPLADLPSPDDHDVPLDIVVTPERIIEVDRTRDRPTGVDWDLLTDDRLAEIPALDARTSADNDK
jgi:5-formyltetrahydrofolate cyclo-ligase